MSPRLSAQQQAEYERKTREAVTVAEKNLAAAAGRGLNEVQHDMAQKVRGFLEQAREAIAAADWTRALTLAQKAQVLSTELIKSL